MTNAALVEDMNYWVYQHVEMYLTISKINKADDIVTIEIKYNNNNQTLNFGNGYRPSTDQPRSATCILCH